MTFCNCGHTQSQHHPALDGQPCSMHGCDCKTYKLHVAPAVSKPSARQEAKKILSRKPQSKSRAT
jgi:hypothetical protein